MFTHQNCEPPIALDVASTVASNAYTKHRIKHLATESKIFARTASLSNFRFCSGSRKFLAVSFHCSIDFSPVRKIFSSSVTRPAKVLPMTTSDRCENLRCSRCTSVAFRATSLCVALVVTRDAIIAGSDALQSFTTPPSITCKTVICTVHIPLSAWQLSLPAKTRELRPEQNPLIGKREI